MPVTYDPIAQTTLASAVATFTFSSIPSTYTDLVVVASPQQTTGADNLRVQFNGDTGSNYNNILIRSGTSGQDTFSAYSVTSIQTDSFSYPPTSNFGVKILQIQGYADTNVQKSVIFRSNSQNGFGGVEYGSALWNSTATISSIRLFCTINYSIGTTFSLYGIKGA
jgi:hypothetical protein